MFATYVYKAGAAVAQVFADVVMLATGAAVADLSAACDKAQTTAIGATPYTLTDVVGWGAMKAPGLDGVWEKHFRFTYAGSTLQLVAMEAWNAATHSAAVTTAAKNGVPVNAGGGVIYVIAGDVLALVSGDGSNNFVVGFELRRDAVQCVGAATPVHGVLGPASSAAGGDGVLVRVKNMMGAGTVANLAVALYGPCGRVGNGVARDVNDVYFVPLLPAFAVSSSAGAAPYFFFGSVRGVWRVSDSAYANGDRISDGDAAYLYVRAADGVAYAIRAA